MKRTTALASVLLLQGCGGPPEVRISEEWRPGPPCSAPGLRLFIRAEPDTWIEVAGRRPVPTSGGGGLSVAVIEFKPSEVPAGETLTVGATRGRHVQQIQHRLKRPTRKVAFPESRGAPAGEPAFIAWTKIVLDPKNTRSGPKATVALDGEAIRFEFPACHVAGGTAAEGIVAAQGDTVTYRVPVSATLARVVAKQMSATDVAFPIKLQSVDQVESEVHLELTAETLARLHFSGLPGQPRPTARAHPRGAPMLFFAGDPALPSTRATLVRAESSALDQVTAVAVRRDRSAVVGRCQYSGTWSGVLERRRWDTDVKVYEVKSGRILAQRGFQGGPPPPCPPEVRVRVGSSPVNVYGTTPSVSEWLESL